MLDKKRNTSKYKLGIEIKEAQKDPNFIKEIKKFIEASTKVYRLN